MQERMSTKTLLRRRRIKELVEDIIGVVVIFSASAAILLWGEIAQAIVAQ